MSDLPARPGPLDLRSPVVVAAFEGWNDAGDAASGAVDYLIELWDARAVAEIDPDEYVDFQQHRPTVRLVDGATRRISWPATRLWACSPPGSTRDVVLLRGVEPNLRWRAFCEQVLAACQQLGATMVVTVGALLADNPHTRPVPVSGTASDPATAQALGLEPSRYEGPTGIVGVLTDATVHAGLPAASFWAAVPHYVSQGPCPKAVIALLRRIEDLLDVAVPLGDLPEQARAWERRVDELAAADSEVAEYVASLEEREPEETLPEASGDAIAREFERYLRRRGDATDG